MRTCGTVAVSPPSGSNFNVGVTTVNVTKLFGGTKSFTVTDSEDNPTCHCWMSQKKGVVTLNAGHGECGSFGMHRHLWLWIVVQ
ncbi:MAG: hypothetical protein IPL98_19560 [Saprospiraceae bacterium]|nr:hypothetical protein [Saprospiraceae bacterium]